MLCSLQEEQVPDLYHSCNIQSPFITIFYLSQQVCTFIILPGSELHTKINKPAVTQGCQSLDAEVHWSLSSISLQQTSHDGISLISTVMCSTT